MMLQLVMATVLSVGPNVGDVRLRGPVAERMDAVVRNHVAKTDPCYLSHPFHSRTETIYFHSEFWGNYMHSAPFFWKYTGDAALKEKIARGVANHPGDLGMRRLADLILEGFSAPRVARTIRPQRSSLPAPNQNQ